MNIGPTIMNLRKARGVTQEQLARALGVSTPAVSKWETGQSCPDIELLAPIARYFGITIDSLLSFSRTLPEEEADRQVKEILHVFERQGHQAGMERCVALIREYPDSQYLKLKITGLKSLYMLYVPQEDQTEENWRQYGVYASKLLEEILQGGESRYRVQAKGMAACYYMQDGDYDRAERALAELPVPEIDPDSLRPTLYLFREDWKKAAEASRKNISRYGWMAVQSMGTLLRAAWEEEDLETATSAAEMCSRLEEMLGGGTAVGLYYQLRLALKTGDIELAQQRFLQSVEQVLRMVSSEERDKAGFLTAAYPQLDRKKKKVLLENELRTYRTEQCYQALAHTPVYREGLEKLEAALEWSLKGEDGERK